MITLPLPPRASLSMLVLLGVLLAQPALAHVYWTEAPDLAPPWTGYNPEFGDLDGDRDVDLVYAVVLQSYRNAGSPALPAWQPDNSFISGVIYEACMTACLADLDGDGDLDLSVGELNGWPLLYYENVGSVAQPVWQRDTNMYEGLPPNSWTCPELADLDGDGDSDLVMAVYWALEAYVNVGTPQVPCWLRNDALVEGVSLSTPLVDPNFGDIDGDGDLDLVLGGRSGEGPITCYENTQSAQAPTWVENEDLLIGVPNSVGVWGLELADLDADGDIDLLAMRGQGPEVYLNQGPSSPVESSSWARVKSLFR